MPEATVDLPLSFSVPEMFRDIDFTVTAETNTDRLIADLTGLDPRPTDDEIAHAIVSQQAMYEMLAAAGAVYAGILLSGPTEDEPEKPLSSMLLSVTARPSELSNEDTVHRLARSMGAIYPDAEVGVVVLPTGPAVLLTEESEVPRPVNLLNAGGGPTVVRQLHVFVPIPGRLAMADFAIATENTAEWDDCVEIIGQVCKTIAFV
ncbi:MULTISPECIES: hypothetical protein [Streptomyces]|uniref:hypothetical protein n=1 Tax=Streptomyces TaxID=1883 RepID=UPI00163C43A6|nr:MULTISPECIES: hypothetical protein [Streptomyces]MBC2875612.1 hypothetical protein [Streptomyces sp. TYQ1024]UBI35843.1 hypothetical protein K7I03_04805 [Streptomyces mobaraensis]UKW28437.1 hypothetical protein MCU78_04805 [Streptomyces sp. TYQ1024]